MVSSTPTGGRKGLKYMALSNFLKKLIIFDVIWGTRSKKLAGINDFNNVITENVTFSSVDNSITFPTPVPFFFQEGEYFRIFGGANDGRLFRAKEINGNRLVMFETPISESNSVRLDARLWVVHNDPKISRPTSTGSTMFNVHNRQPTNVPEDASALAFTFAEHYHDEEGTEDDVGEIISTEYNELGYKSKVLADCCDEIKVDLGPQLIFDDEGNVIRVKKDDDLEVC